MQVATYPHEAASASGSESESDGGGCCGPQSEQGVQKGPIQGMPAYIRRGFVRKVYSILTVQLLLTAAIASAIGFYATKTWVKANIGLFYASCFGTMALMLGMACCCPQAARVYPTNYIFLFSFTILEAITIGFVCTIYTGPSILLAFSSTTLVFLSLTAYACFTKTDFTGMGPYLYMALSCMIMFSFTMWAFSFFMPIPAGVNKIYALVGVILFSAYIVYDTQLIIGGQHKSHQFEVDDYCFAALNLYLDIINMFLYLLELFGDRR